MMSLRRRLKQELILAIMLAISISVLTVYLNQPRKEDDLFRGSSLMPYDSLDGSSGSYEVEQIVKENIKAELRKGTFETVVESLRNLAFSYRGRTPYSSMMYDNELWKGTLEFSIPTVNVTSFTFEVRQFIGSYGKVTQITISIVEVEPAGSEDPVDQSSEVVLNLKEVAEGESPIIIQIGTVVPWMVTSLVWIAQGLVIGLPLCFVSLAVVLLITRGIVPLWRHQLKSGTSGKTVD